MKGLPFLFPYFGSKSLAALKYPRPSHSRIIEPFAGSAGYALRYFTHDVLLVDADENIVRTWDYLINVSREEILGLPLLRPDQRVSELNVCPEAKLLIGWWVHPGSSRPHDKESKMVKGKNHMHAIGWSGPTRSRIARDIEGIRHWHVERGSYADIPNGEATWFIDPPYQREGREYRCRDIDYAHLAQWSLDRRGQIIVCESEGADWLPFTPFTPINRVPGKQKVNVAKYEVIYTNDWGPQ